MPISTILKGCGRAKVDVGVYFNGYDQFEECDYTSCTTVRGTTLVYLNGKKIGEITTTDEKGNENKSKEETEVIEFTFHHGSKIEFLLSKIIDNYSSNVPGIKFKSFKIVECFSKCE